MSSRIAAPTCGVGSSGGKSTDVRGAAGLGRGPADVRRPGPFRATVAKLELDAVALAQHLDALAVNGAGMKKYLFAGGISNKAEPFVCS